MTTRIDEAVVERLYRQADASRWQVPVDHFAAALEASAAKAFAGRTPSARDLERYLGSLRLEELALACACAAGHDAAWEHFVLEYRPVLYRAADAMDPSGGARELADSLYADLFGMQVDPPSTPVDPASTSIVSGYPPSTSVVSGFSRTGQRRSLFRYFHGRSSLATWLRAVLAQRLVDRARARTRTAPLPDEEPAAPAAQTPDPDRDRYLPLIHAAFRDALARLDARDRLRLLYYYAQGLTLAQTGRLLREHEASVSRHLSSARKAIRREVERQLREVQALDPNEIERCFAYVTEDAGPLDLDKLLSNSNARNPEADVQSENRGDKILESAPRERMRR
jgi:RNA polymerase sigma-70 factor, ECF subfamily